MVPYVGLYLLARVGHLPIQPVRTVFIVLHVVNGLLFVVWLVPKLRHANWRIVPFWIALAALFLVPGAYFEFPADPWGHLERIYSWGTLTAVHEHHAVNKFAYFWAWTWLGEVPIESRPPALTAYTAFWQLLLALQFYRIARVLGFSPGWALAQVFGTVALFGTNLFSFYRYYALGSTPLAYIAYLYGLGRALEPGRPPLRRLVAPIAIATVVAWANHGQELLFLAIMVPAVLAFEGISAMPALRRRRVLAIGAGVVVGSVVVGACLRAWWPSVYGPGVDAVSPLGVYPLWNARSVFFETLAIPGWLGVLAACAVARVRPRLALVTLWPVGLLLLPPFVLFVSLTFPDTYIVYRVLYAFPISFALVGALESLTPSWTLRTVSALALVCLSLVPTWPVRGRLYFQLYVPPAVNQLVHLYPAVGDLARRASFKRRCLIASDQITNFFLSAQLGVRLRVDRLTRDDPLEAWRQSESVDVIEGRRGVPVCAAVLLRPEQVPESPGSMIARESGHWQERDSDPRSYVSASASELMDRVAKAGWQALGPGVWVNPTWVASGLVSLRPPDAAGRR
jgi:hypothetical protein